MPIFISSARQHGRVRVRSHTLAPALAQLAFAAVALGAIEIVLIYNGLPGTPPWQVLLLPMLGALYLAAGLVAWWRRPSNRTGALLTAGGLAWLAAGLYNALQGVLFAVGLMTATLGLAIVVHLLHAFPSGRLRGGWSVATVLTGYVVCIVLQAPLYLFSPGPLELTDRADLARAGQWLQDGVGSVVMIATAVILALRLSGLGRSQRRVVGPLYAYGVLAVLLVPVSAQLHWLFPFSALTLVEVQAAAIAGVAIAFVLAMLLGGFARTVELQELGAWLGAEEDAQLTLEAALADALGDPSLALAFWINDSGTYADAAGREVQLPPAGGHRAAAEVELRGQPIGAINYDATLLPDPGLVRAAGRIVALALERERLTAALLASRERVRASRARIAQAADQERRRIARDLHDGLQTRLVVLAIKADMARAMSGESAPVEAREVHAGLQSAIAELRELVHGLMPAALTEGGLYEAVQELVAQSPIPTRLELDPPRAALSPPTETASYFVIAEALTNAVKHSRACELQLRIAGSNGRLRIEVADDGIGGAGRGEGSGLRGIADRIEALDGRLWLDSPAGGGTRLVAELPCAS